MKIPSIRGESQDMIISLREMIEVLRVFEINEMLMPNSKDYMGS